MKKILLPVALTCVIPSFAQYKMKPIVHSSKQGVEAQDVIEDYRVLKEDKIEIFQPHQLEEIVRTLPGVTTANTGAVGAASSVFVRGSESRHTIVLIDGVRYHDPTSVDRTINLAVLKTLDIQRIEFLRGSQGVLYGSDAIAGVLNIITKKGDGGHSFNLGAGYFTQMNARNTFVVGKNIFAINAHYFETDAQSAAKGESEKDHNVNKGFSLKHSYEGDIWASETSLKYTDAHVDTDTVEFTTGKPIDEDATFSKHAQTFLNQKLSYKIADQRTLFFNLGYAQHKRRDKFYSDTTLQYFKNNTDGDNLFFEAKVKEQFLDGSLIYGVSQSRDYYDSEDLAEQEQGIIEYFFNHHQKYWGNTFSYGARLAQNEDFGDHLVYKFALEREYLKDMLKAGAAVGTGFKAPSIYQQFAPNDLGNEDLAPEKSFDWEIFNEFKYKNYRSRLTYFNLEIENLIEFPLTSYVNTGKLTVKGFEFGQRLRFKSFYVSLDMTVQTLEKDDGTNPLRRPQQVYDLAYGHDFNDNHSMQALIKWVGERYDQQTAGSVTEEFVLGDYALVDLSYRFEKKDISLIASIKNLFDSDYEVVKDYSTLGRSVAVDLGFKY